MSLNEYRHKRHFDRTSEPEGGEPTRGGRQYLIQKHAASRLHYDFRLELGGVLKSWAVPKGPSLDPARKTLAVHVEDHPLEYGSFEGTIPEGEYGGGTVMLWDRGTWEPEGDPAESYRRGKLVFRLNGERLHGGWALIRMGGKAGQDGKNWLLKKLDDDASADADHEAVDEFTTSVVSGRTMDQIAHNAASRKKSTSKKQATPKSTGPERADRRVRKPNASASDQPTAPRKAARSKIPGSIAPELPTLVEEIPHGREWIYELKLDGYRMIGRVHDGKATLFTRRGHDWTHRFPTIAAALEEVKGGDAIVDGEVVVLKHDGTSDFQALQNAMRQGNHEEIVFFVFDLLYHRGCDLRPLPLIERKKMLKSWLGKSKRSGLIRYNDHLSGAGDQIFTQACHNGLEGIVAKRIDSQYQERRSTDWVKVKCLKRQEFVVGGWTDPSGARDALGALLVGYYRGPSELVYCGRVGTGFTEQSLRDLRRSLQPLTQKTCPFSNPPAGVAARGVIHWVKPKVVVEVAFAAWTDDGLLRHASFQGIREDKAPAEITRESPVDIRPSEPERSEKSRPSRVNATAAASKPSRRTKTEAADLFAGVRLTHPDRVLFPDATHHQARPRHLLHGRRRPYLAPSSRAGHCRSCAVRRARRRPAFFRSISPTRCPRPSAASPSRRKGARPPTSPSTTSRA